MSTETAEMAVMERGPLTPLALIQSALDKGLNPERLGKLLDLQERWESLRAREEYGRALAAFQRECPQVPKTRPVLQKNGDLRYKYAALEDVVKAAGPVMAAHGIAATFSQDMTDRDVITTVRVQVGSHAEDKRFVSPRPNFEAAGAIGQTVPQAYGATLTYYRRYALCAALGIVVCGEDSDAAADGVGLQAGLSEDQVRELKSRIAAKGIDLGRFLSLANVPTLDEITQARYPRALEWIDQFKPQKEKAS